MSIDHHRHEPSRHDVRHTRGFGFARGRCRTELRQASGLVPSWITTPFSPSPALLRNEAVRSSDTCVSEV